MVRVLGINILLLVSFFMAFLAAPACAFRRHETGRYSPAADDTMARADKVLPEPNPPRRV